MATETDYTRKCQQLDVLIDLLEKENRRLQAEKEKRAWKPVDLENNKPPLEEWVLVSSDGYVTQDCIVERGGKKIWYHGGNIQPNDRYMPLPAPYKEDAQ